MTDGQSVNNKFSAIRCVFGEKRNIKSKKPYIHIKHN